MVKITSINSGTDQTMGFSALNNRNPFGFEFMQHLGAPQTYGSTQTQVHVIGNHMECNNIEPIGFFYPLYRYENSD